MKLIIEHDQFTECPLEYARWEMFSFSNRHHNFKHPNEFFPANIGLRRKLDTGTAFVLSYYQHGNVQWGLQGEVNQCRWDTAQVAGILLWKDNVKYLQKGLEKRKENARWFLKEYTSWCNGECYGYCIEDDNEEVIDSCGGWIGEEHLVEALKNEHPNLFADDAVFEISGEAAWIMNR